MTVEQDEAASPVVVHEPAIGVVILNWNGHADTIQCLDSVFAGQKLPARVVVVDNASEDDSVARLRRWAGVRGIGACVEPAPPVTSPPQYTLTILCADRNRGFAGGNNLGIDWLLSDPTISHVLLLNNDTTVELDFFRALDAALRKAPDAGLLGCTIYEAENPSRVWYAGGHFRPYRALVLHDTEHLAGSDPVRTEFVTGCAMLIPRATIARIGKLAECYFPLYMEDAEYSYRAGAAGLPVVVVPNAKVYHQVGATVGSPQESPVVAYCSNRHRAFFVRRNLVGWRKLMGLSYLAVTKPGKALVETLVGRPRIGWAVLRGTLAGFLSSEAKRGIT